MSINDRLDAVLAEMDKAVEQAKPDFDQLPPEAKDAVGEWMEKWYMKAGFKRLGRLLVAYVGRRKKSDKDFHKTKNVPHVVKEFTVSGRLAKYIEEINQYNILTKEEEFRLAKRFRETGDLESRDKLICANLRIVVYIARKYQNFHVDLLELISAGNEGLEYAVDKFDERRGYRFNTYSVWWIKRAIYNVLSARRNIVERSFLARRVRVQTKRFVQKNGREPTAEELAAILNTDTSAIALAQSELFPPHSWDKLYEDIQDSVMEIDDALEEAESPFIDPFLRHIPKVDIPLSLSPVEIHIAETRKKELNEALSKIGSREREVLGRNFGLGEYEAQTLEEISRIMNITRERVRQIKENALRKLKIVMSK